MKKVVTIRYTSDHTTRRAMAKLWNKWVHITDTKNPIELAYTKLMNFFDSDSIREIETFYKSEVDKHIKLNEEAIAEVLALNLKSEEDKKSATRILNLLNEKRDLLEEDKNTFCGHTQRFFDGFDK